MSFLAALGGIQSVLGAISGNRAGQAMSRRGQQTVDSGLGVSRKSYEQMMNQYQNDSAQGAYDPGKALLQARHETDHLYNIDRGNVGARLRGMGFKNGDSSYVQGQRQLSERTNLALQKQILDITNAYRQMRNADLAQAGQFGNQYASLSSQAGQQQYQQGLQMQSANNVSNVLAQLEASPMGTKEFWDWTRKFSTTAEQRGKPTKK